MAKIVINRCYGGFGLSTEAEVRYRELAGVDEGFSFYSIDREDPFLIQIVEDLGDAANGAFAKLCVDEVPDGTLYRIAEDDGNESIETCDSTRWSIAGAKK